MNIQQVRRDTPGCRHHLHLNNAGASLPTKYVLEAMQTYLAEEALNGTTVLNTLALFKGAGILRVHDIREATETVKLISQLN